MLVYGGVQVWCYVGFNGCPKMRLDLILVSAGFDAVDKDPLGELVALGFLTYSRTTLGSGRRVASVLCSSQPLTTAVAGRISICTVLCIRPLYPCAGHS
jgi:hypothetical protein